MVFDFVGCGFRGCGKTQHFVIPSEARNPSFFIFLYLNRREIPRFARNDGINYFFRKLFNRDIKNSKNHRALAPGSLTSLGGFQFGS
jgi:hypothetical protein